MPCGAARCGRQQRDNVSSSAAATGRYVHVLDTQPAADLWGHSVHPVLQATTSPPSHSPATPIGSSQALSWSAVTPSWSPAGAVAGLRCAAYTSSTFGCHQQQQHPVLKQLSLALPSAAGSTPDIHAVLGCRCRTREEGEAQLQRLLDAGITTFYCLQVSSPLAPHRMQPAYIRCWAQAAAASAGA
jgi:hypothetical protein